MRQVIVSNFSSVDGYYSGPGGDMHVLFAKLIPEYATGDDFDWYNTSLLRAAGTVLFSGRSAFLGNRDYWHGVLSDPAATPIRRKFATLLEPVEKLVVSDHLRSEETGAWSATTRIVPRAEGAAAVRELKSGRGGSLFLYGGRTLWNHLLREELLDELHLTVFPFAAGEGIPLFDHPPRAGLRLLESKIQPGTGAVLLRYAAVYPPAAQG